MKDKIIIFFALVMFLIPMSSQAYIFVPTANLTVNVATPENNNFNFNLSVQTGSDPVFHNYSQFNLQTESLAGSHSSQVTTFSISNYLLSQENISGLKINSILCTSDNPNDIFWYQQNNVEFSPITNESITCTFNNIKISSKTPVLIVPGLLGTEIKNEKETLWVNPKMVNPLNDDSFMDSLTFLNSLNPSDSQVFSSGVIKSIKTNIGGADFILYDYAGDLMHEFQDQGYVENETLFTFPYDWRYGVSGKYSDGKTNVDLLKQKIADIIQKTGSDKVDVVAHSLGGLIVKKYVMDNAGNHKINKAVFVGVPNTGAPKAVKVLLQGDNFNVLGLNDSEMKKIAENMPAAYDLLPSQQYYNQKGSYIETIDEVNLDTGNPSLQNTIKDLSYAESKNFLATDHSLNSQAIVNAENIHTQSFDDFDLRTAGVNLFAIDGCKTGTLGKIIEARRDAPFGKTIEYKTPKIIPGDGTVPLESSTNLPIDQNNKFYALSVEHGKMLSANGSRQEIVNLVSGSALSTGNNLITQDISKCNLNGKAISVFSPIDIFVTDQNGNRLGLAEDGSIINEIPGADFEIWGEHKFVFVPTDNGEVYTTNLTGTGSGTYTIKSEDIQNSQTEKTEVFSNLPATTALTGQINLNSDDSTTLLVKQTATSQTQTIQPSTTLTGEELKDILPPISKATIGGNFTKQGFYRGEVVVKIKAKDKESKIFSIQYNVDNTGLKKVLGDKVEIKIKKEGKHVITFFATDKAGNNEQEQTITFEIISPNFLPKDKDQCKKDGWKKFGKEFKNQGECVGFVEKYKPKK